MLLKCVNFSRRRELASERSDDGAPCDTAPSIRVCGARSVVFGALASAAALFMSGAEYASAQSKTYQQHINEANNMTVTIVAGGPGETSLDIAQDLAVVLHCVDGLRIVPVVGRGDAHNVYDLLFLRGVDMAVVRADVLDYVAETNAYVANLKRQVVYIAHLFDQEVHLIASTKIKSIKDLEGKLVNIGAPGTIALEAERILKAAGVKVVSTKFDNKLALERVLDGSLDGMFITGGKPLPLLDQLKDATGLHLVPIPTSPNSIYKTTVFTNSDYPSLVSAEGDGVPTISVPSVLAAYNWAEDEPRYAKTKVFTEALYRRAAYLRRPARHAKWGASALLEDISGWERFGPAAVIVEALRPKTVAAAPSNASASSQAAPSQNGRSEAELRALFEQRMKEFKIVPRDDTEREQLYRAFKRMIAVEDAQ